MILSLNPPTKMIMMVIRVGLVGCQIGMSLEWIQLVVCFASLFFSKEVRLRLSVKIEIKM